MKTCYECNQELKGAWIGYRRLTFCNTQCQKLFFRNSPPEVPPEMWSCFCGGKDGKRRTYCPVCGEVTVDLERLNQRRKKEKR